MKIVIAPDSFKGSISAAGAASALAAGWRAIRPGDELVLLPLADGGEGTLEIVHAAVPGAAWRRARVTGPDGRRVDSSWLSLPDGTAVVELARAAGLTLLASPDPLRAHTTGLGEVIGRALDEGARSLTVTLGGSASTDGGTGALTALGARFLDRDHRPLPPGGGALARLWSVDLAGLRPPPAGGVTCLTDVTAPLLGPGGSAAVFAPQKGAGHDQVRLLEAGLARLAGALGGNPAAPGAGAAGGTGSGLAAAWGANLTGGAARLAALAGLERALAGAALVITGEGCYDQTSQAGKVVGTVIGMARARAVPVALAAGRITARPPAHAVVSLTELAGSATAAQREPARWLEGAGQRLARSWH